MKQFDIMGMSCAACSTRVEKAVSGLSNVEKCTVNLLTNSMSVEGTVSQQEIIEAVEKAGYGALPKTLFGTPAAVNESAGKMPVQVGGGERTSAEIKQESEKNTLIKRLLYSLGFLAVLMYLSMGHVMLGWPVPAFLANNTMALALTQLLLTTVILVINQRFFVSGFRGLVHKSPNMDTLVALGSGAAYMYSLYVLYEMTGAVIYGDVLRCHLLLHDLYFESAAMIVTLITVGKMLEARAKGKTTDALKALMKLTPMTATVLREGKEIEILAEQVEVGDIFVVRPGEAFAVDGEVLEGNGTVDESALTGESLPVEKGQGDKVASATINRSGFLKCRALRVGQDTTLAQIIQMVSDAAAGKAPIAKLADKVSGFFVPLVMGIALVTIVGWFLAGETFGYALARGISVLVISCPCALGLATPVAIMVGTGVGAGQGIMFKTAEALEEAGKTQIVVLDKTGTITSGKMSVTDVVICAEGYTMEELLCVAHALERKSSHPLAKAVAEYAEEKLQAEPAWQKEEPKEAIEFENCAGLGVRGVIEGEKYVSGNLKFVTSYMKIDSKWQNEAERLAEEGKTPIFFAGRNQLLGILAVADTLKKDSGRAVSQLLAMGKRVVMLTGDHPAAAKVIADRVGITEVVAGVLPDGKEQAIMELQKQGKVAMVGDGINDAPALCRADMGIAIGAGTDVAMDAAQIVLAKSSLLDVPAAIRLSKATLRNIKQNLFWAFFYNVIGIPLAAGLFVPIFHWEMNPMFGAAAMSLSSFCVVSNALRLNLLKVHESGLENEEETVQKETHLKKEETKKESEKKVMTKTMMVEGMMCGHCEARVKRVLEALEQVQEAKVSHTEGTAVLTLTEDLSNERLKQIIESEGYEVKEIR